MYYPNCQSEIKKRNRTSAKQNTQLCQIQVLNQPGVLEAKEYEFVWFLYKPGLFVYFVQK